MALVIAYGVANIAAAIPSLPGVLGVVEATVSGILVGSAPPGRSPSGASSAGGLVNFWLPIPVGGAAYLSSKVHPPADNQAGLAARRALWRARWRWVVDLFGRDAPTPVVPCPVPVHGHLEDADTPVPGTAHRPALPGSALAGLLPRVSGSCRGPGGPVPLFRPPAAEVPSEEDLGDAVEFDLDVVVVGGCGHVGLPLALAFADRGLSVSVSTTWTPLPSTWSVPGSCPSTSRERPRCSNG